MRKPTMQILISDGRNEARAYAKVVVHSSRPEPSVEMERVQIVDPRLTSTVQLGTPSAGSGPRNPEQTVWAQPEPPAVDLPDRLPVTKAQRVFIDPELVARWRAEAQTKETT
jgi:hypothetical protein